MSSTDTDSGIDQKDRGRILKLHLLDIVTKTGLLACTVQASSEIKTAIDNLIAEGKIYLTSDGSYYKPKETTPDQKLEDIFIVTFHTPGSFSDGESTGPTMCLIPVEEIMKCTLDSTPTADTIDEWLEKYDWYDDEIDTDLYRVVGYWNINTDE